MQKIEKFTMGECSNDQTLTTQGCISTYKLRPCPVSLTAGQPGTSEYITYTQYTLQDSITGVKKGVKCISSMNPEIPTNPKCSVIWGTDAKLVGGNNSPSAPQNSCYVNYITSQPQCEEDYKLITKKDISICTKSDSIDHSPTNTYICPANTTLDTSTSQPYCLI